MQSKVIKQAPRPTESIGDAPPNRESTLGLVFIVAVLLLAAGVRLLGLGNTDLWGDEAFSVMLSVGPLRHMFAALSVAEPHPPLYPLLLAGWLRVLGRSEMIARLPSAFVGILSVAVAINLARTFTPSKPRWLSAVCPSIVGLLVALNPIQVWYSQEARMYEQTSFFAGLATLALLRLWQGKRGGATVYVLAVLGTAGSHYYGLFVPLAHLIAVLIASIRRRDLLRRWAVPTAISAVLYLPWVFVAFHVFTKYYGAQPGTVPLFSVALSSWVRVAAGWSLTWQHAEFAAVIVSALIVFGLIVPARSELDHFARLVLACWLFTPFVAGFLISLVRPMYAERYLVVSSLPMILLAGRGIIWLLTGARAPLGPLVARPRLAVTALGTVALLVALGTALVPLENVWHGAYLKSAYNTHMREVDALSIAGDGVILDGVSQTPLYDYYQKKLMPMYPLPDKLPLNPGETSGILDQIASKQTGVWVFLYATPDYDPSYFIPRWLQSHAYLGFDQWAVNGRLQYYRFAAPSALTTKASNVRFGQSLLLTHFGWGSSGVPAGGTIPVDLQWRWLNQPIPQPRVALRLVDSTGFTWAQSDQFIGGNVQSGRQSPTATSLDDHHGLMIPLGTPPGRYRLILNVYGTGQSQPLPAKGDGATLGPEGMTVGQIQVNAAAQRIWPDGFAGYQSVGTTFVGQVLLLGGAGSQSVKAGESGYLTLFWKALVAHPDVNKVR
ncbi:MAG TPA: glycosyltransferase family 39 protein, partial [Chloroflexota bacterium]|nr:glycosyltransferase family 39 protein [Chloroflexota bacterium]